MTFGWTAVKEDVPSLPQDDGKVEQAQRKKELADKQEDYRWSTEVKQTKAKPERVRSICSCHTPFDLQTFLRSDFIAGSV